MLSTPQDTTCGIAFSFMRGSFIGSLRLLIIGLEVSIITMDNFYIFCFV